MDKLKSDFGQLKADGHSFTWKELDDFCSRTIDIRVDFDDEELGWRQELWRERIHMLEKHKASPCEDSKVNCEVVRSWLEEGQELEIVTDQKYEALTEIVDDIDSVCQALRYCNTEEEVDLVWAQECEKGALDFWHISAAQKKKI